MLLNMAYIGGRKPRNNMLLLGLTGKAVRVCWGLLARVRVSAAYFQADDEGSIPFTRSKRSNTNEEASCRIAVGAARCSVGAGRPQATKPTAPLASTGAAHQAEVETSAWVAPLDTGAPRFCFSAPLHGRVPPRIRSEMDIVSKRCPLLRLSATMTDGQPERERLLPDRARRTLQRACNRCHRCLLLGMPFERADVALGPRPSLGSRGLLARRFLRHVDRLPDIALPASTKQPAIRKLVSELFEEGLRDVRVKSPECQALINNFTRCNPGKCCKIINRRCRMATPSCFCRRQKMGDIEQQQHVLTSFVQKSIFATAQL